MKVPTSIPFIEADYPLPVIEPKDPGQVWRAIGGAAGEAQNLVNTLVQIEQGKKKVQDALDLQTGIDDYRTRMADHILNLDKDPNKTNYAERIKSGSLEIQNDIYGKMKSPNVQNALKVKFSDLGTDYYIKGKIYENDWFMKIKSGDAEEKLFNIEKMAGMATSDIERAKLGAEGIRLIDSLTGTIYNPEQASKRKIKLSEEIEKEQLKNTIAKARAEIIKTPENAENIIEEYNIPDDKIEPLLKLSTSLIEKREKGIEKGTKDFSDIMKADLIERMRGGEDVIDIIYEYGPSKKRMLISNDYDALITERDKLFGRPGDWKSDLNAEFEIEKNLYSERPTITEDQIKAKTFEGVGGISKEKMSTYLQNLRTWRKGQISEERAIINREYDEAKSHIATGLGISGMIAELYENIDPAQKKALHLAREELWRRSRGGGGEENPMDVAIEILPRYRRVLKDENLISIDHYQKLLMYPDPDSLKRAWIEKRITEGTYQTQQKIFFELSEKIGMDRRIEEAEAAKEQPKKDKKGPYK